MTGPTADVVFLTNRVPLCIDRDPAVRLRDIDDVLALIDQRHDPRADDRQIAIQVSEPAGST